MSRIRPAIFLLGLPFAIRGSLLSLAALKGDECKRDNTTTVGLRPECIGAPDQMNLLCPHTDSSAKSVHINASIKIGFNNTSGEEVAMYWLDFNGKEIFQRFIAPGDVSSQDTYLGHVFRLRSKSNGKNLLEHTVGLIPLRNDAKITDFPKDNRSKVNTKLGRVTHDKAAVGGFEVGFVNRAGGFLKLYYFRAEDNHKELVAQLHGGSVYPQFTYRGHEFRAYTGDGRLVTSARIGHIIVPSCIDHHKVQQRNHVQRLIATAVDQLKVWEEVESCRDTSYEEDHQNVFECFSMYCALKPSRVRSSGFLGRYETESEHWSASVV